MNTSQEPALRTIAMPSDTNPYGDIFGGWLMSQMDLAGANVATRRAVGRVVTVAIDGMEFHEPVSVGDEVSCYATVVRTGTTSITVDVVAYKRKKCRDERFRVTSGTYTFVKIDSEGRPQALPPVEK